MHTRKAIIFRYILKFPALNSNWYNPDATNQIMFEINIHTKNPK